MMKRPFALFLCLALCLTVLIPGTAFAQEDSIVCRPGDDIDVVFFPDEGTGHPGEVLCALSYDHAVFTLISASDLPDQDGFYFPGNLPAVVSFHVSSHASAGTYSIGMTALAGQDGEARENEEVRFVPVRVTILGENVPKDAAPSVGFNADEQPAFEETIRTMDDARAALEGVAGLLEETGDPELAGMIADITAMLEGEIVSMENTQAGYEEAARSLADTEQNMDREAAAVADAQAPEGVPAGPKMLSWFRTRIAENGDPQLWLSMASLSGLRSVTILRRDSGMDQGQEETVESMPLGGAEEALRYCALTKTGEYRVVIESEKGEKDESDVLIRIEDTDANGVPDTLTDANGQVILLTYENAFAGR